MTYARRTDANQTAIVEALRAAGCSVVILSSLGHGVPDLLCGYQGRAMVLECKVEKGRLTPDEARWWDDWRGPGMVVYSVDDALAAIGAIHPRGGVSVVVGE